MTSAPTVRNITGSYFWLFTGFIAIIGWLFEMGSLSSIQAEFDRSASTNNVLGISWWNLWLQFPLVIAMLYGVYSPMFMKTYRFVLIACTTLCLAYIPFTTQIGFTVIQIFNSLPKPQQALPNNMAVFTSANIYLAGSIMMAIILMFWLIVVGSEDNSNIRLVVLGTVAPRVIGEPRPQLVDAKTSNKTNIQPNTNTAAHTIVNNMPTGASTSNNMPAAAPTSNNIPAAAPTSNNMPDAAPTSNNAAATPQVVTNVSTTSPPLNSAASGQVVKPAQSTTPQPTTQPPSSPASQPPPSTSASPAPISTLPVGMKAKALYAYKANLEDPNEISFEKGMIFDVVDNKGKWWQVKSKEGKVGIAPSNYLAVLT